MPEGGALGGGYGERLECFQGGVTGECWKVWRRERRQAERVRRGERGGGVTFWR